ncbi:MAG TPA: response regulator transcription factor [Chitinophagaceae bacterium]|nr:response regulator transcription factor [Chitinophagaceae bacterium]
MSSAQIRIILVDDHKLIRESWKTLLENNSSFKVIADCDNGRSAIEHAKVLMPDIMLVDINMSPENGFDVARRMNHELPSIKVIGLSVNNQPKYAIRMIELGAKGYLTKTSSLEEITHGITEVHHGHIYICDEVRKHMQQEK